MSLDSELAVVQGALGWFVPTPRGQNYAKAIGILRANLPRVEADTPEILDFVNEMTPVIRKHFPALMAFEADFVPVFTKHYAKLNKSVNDLLPIVEAISKALEGQ